MDEYNSDGVLTLEPAKIVEERCDITSDVFVLDSPRLTAQQVEALNILDAELARPGSHTVLKVEAGDLLVIDNHRCLHAKDTYDDLQEQANGRLAMRVWAAHVDSPTLPTCFSSLYGDVPWRFDSRRLRPLH